MKTYLIAFLLCVLLTFVQYFVVDMHLFSSVLLMTIVALGFVLQAILQFVYFMRLGQETTSDKVEEQLLDPHAHWNWNLLFFLFTILIVLCVVVGSIWIMYNLDYRM